MSSSRLTISNDLRRNSKVLPCSREWFFPSTSDRWLSILRIGLAVQLLLYAFSIHGDWIYLLSGTGRGLVSRDFAEALLSLESPLIPRLGWLVNAGKQLGVSEPTLLDLSWYGLIVASLFVLVGLFCRPAAIAAWLIHLSAVKSGGLVTYGVDALTTTGLFYLALSPLPDRFSLDRFWRKKIAGSQLLGFWRRVLQLHLCLIYFFSRLTKALGRDWWNGMNLWRSVTRPPFDLIPVETLVRFKYFFPIAGVAVLLLEIGYPFLIWPGRIGRRWLLAILVMHAGIGLAMGMYLFASVMIILNLAAFGPGKLWRDNGTREDAGRAISPGVA
ncbi:MAG: hypothetical protein DME57_00040 [Verrucomicrobia bacterium]|nr:MAG: hypothetical protein DME57_00040 [Verrucomicrobiota bacterium]